MNLNSLLGKRVTLMLVFFIFTTVMMTSCDNSEKSNAKNPSSNESSKIEITVAQWGTEKYLIYLPFYIAQEMGFFMKNGLHVKVEFGGNDDQVFAKVLRGDAQFGIGDPIFTAVSRERGADGVVVANIVGKVALWGVSKKISKEVSSDNFDNKRIGTFPRPSTTYTLLKNTISKKKESNAQIVEIPIGNELALLESDSADIVMLLEPAASIAEQKGYNIVTSFPKIWGDFAFTGLTSTESYVNQNKEITAKMIDALQAAVELAHNDREAAYSVATELFPTIDKTIIINAVNRMLDDETLPKSVALDQESWETSMRIRQQVGDISNDFFCPKCLYKR